MATQRALYLPEIGAEFTLGKNRIPEPGPGEVLVKLEASGLNKLDVIIQKVGFYMVEEYPAILGEEGAGVVRKVGDGVTNLVQGDKVLFQTVFRNEYTSFQEYCLVDAELTAKIPPNLSFDEAAAIPATFSPFAVATYAPKPRGISLTPPFEEDGLGKYSGRPIVIFGGSSSVGQQAIQLARMSGFSPIITTASPRNHRLLLSLGATHVVDRRLPNPALIKRIRELDTPPLTYIFDAVSLGDTQRAAYALLAPGGTLAAVSALKVGGDDDGSGKTAFVVSGSFDAPLTRRLGINFLTALTIWLEERDIQPNRVEVLRGGLSGIAGGVRRLEEGVSATKLIVRPPETTGR